MPVFGFEAETTETGTPNSTVSLAATFAYTASGTNDVIGVPARYYQPSVDGEQITHVGATIRNASGNVSNAALAVYEYVPDGDAAVFGVVGAKVAQAVVTPLPNDGVWYKYNVALAAPFTMDVLKTYILAIQGDTTNALITIDGPERATATSAERDFGAALYGGLLDPWAGAAWGGTVDSAIFATYTVPSDVTPTLTTPYPMGTNNGPLFSVSTSNSLATIEAAGFFNGNAAYASLLKTDDVLIINASDGVKMYTVTVDQTARIISLSTGLTIT